MQAPERWFLRLRIRCRHLSQDRIAKDGLEQGVVRLVWHEIERKCELPKCCEACIVELLLEAVEAEFFELALKGCLAVNNGESHCCLRERGRGKYSQH